MEMWKQVMVRGEEWILLRWHKFDADWKFGNYHGPDEAEELASTCGYPINKNHSETPTKTD